MTTASRRIALALTRPQRHRLEQLATDTDMPLATVLRLIVQDVLSSIPDPDEDPHGEAVYRDRLLQLLMDDMRRQWGRSPGREALATGKVEKPAQEAPIGPGGHPAEQPSPTKTGVSRKRTARA